MQKERIEKLATIVKDPGLGACDIIEEIEAELLQEVYHALCFMCKGQGEPVQIAGIWMHLHVGGDGKVYSKSECKNSPLREYFFRQEHE